MKRIYTILCAALWGACAANAQETEAPVWSITMEEGAFEGSLIETIDYIIEGEIGAETFMGCHQLEGLTVTAPEPARCDRSAFQGVDMSAKQLRVLAEPGSASRYREAEGWSRFGDIYSQYYTMLVYLMDGSAVSCVFDHHPRLTFDDQMNVFFTSDQHSLTWDLADVDCFGRKLTTDHLVGTPIQSAEADQPTFSLQDGQVSLTRPAGDLRLLTADGRLLRTAKAADGRASISLESLPAGIYMVSDGVHSIKVINK